MNIPLPVYPTSRRRNAGRWVTVSEARVAPAPSKARAGLYPPWHGRLGRVFETDVLGCPKCGGRLRLLCAVHDGFSARRALLHDTAATLLAL